MPYGIYARPSAEERFMAMVSPEPMSGCWLWCGSTTHNGYPQFKARRGCDRAHRFSYSHFVRPFDPKLTIDHLCRNIACVNPAHLEPVTNRENILRGTSWSAKNARKTHCARGHEFSSDNTIFRPSGGRRCKLCERINHRLAA